MDINTLILDCDGVLTPGIKEVGDDGNRYGITFNAKDDTAIDILLGAGIRVVVVTASNYEGIAAYMRKRGVDVFNVQTAHKKDIYRMAGIDPMRTMVIGDDIPDITMMKMAKLAVCPSDASNTVKGLFVTLETKGGQGIVGQALKLLVKTY